MKWSKTKKMQNRATAKAQASRFNSELSYKRQNELIMATMSSAGQISF
jgi:hypothetical protein